MTGDRRQGPLGRSGGLARQILACAAAFCALAGAAALGVQEAEAAELHLRIDTGEGTCLNLRSAPGTENEPLDCVPHGTEVVAGETSGGWSAVRLPNGRTGWSISKALTPIAGPEEVAEESSVMPTPVAPAPAVAPDRTGVGDYAIGVGDVLLVEVFGLPELTRKTRVLGDGTISLPLLGNLPISGLTVAAAEQRISGLLKEKELVKDPQVSIFMEEFVSLGIVIQGAVDKPGVYPLTGPRSLLELLGEAGGLLGGDSGAGNSLYVLRGDTEESRERIDIDLRKLFDEGDVSLDISLSPGDIVVVPQARTYKVYVTGAASKPGPVSFLSSDGITLLQAVTAAGGPTERANLSNLYVLRTLPDGSQERIKANLKKISRGKEPDIALEKNDVVVIGEWIL